MQCASSQDKSDPRSFKPSLGHIDQSHNSGRAITFSRQVKEAGVVARGRVVLGGGSDDFQIGPAVDIRCGVLELRSTGIVVRGVPNKPKDSDGVVIEASRCESMVSRKPLVRGSLSVSWPNAESYPWNDFAVSAEAKELDTQEMHRVHLRFRRIVTSLRSHSKGSLARFKDKVEHRRVLKNQMGKALLASLLDDGILKLEDDFYHWVPERAAAVLKVSYHDLRNRRVTPEMKAYFSKFIAENQKLI